MNDEKSFAIPIGVILIVLVIGLVWPAALIPMVVLWFAIIVAWSLYLRAGKK